MAPFFLLSAVQNRARFEAGELLISSDRVRLPIEKEVI
jgi:hypothetical protein